jgi:hypothetical protein
LQRGWSQADLAQRAEVPAPELQAIDTDENKRTLATERARNAALEADLAEASTLASLRIHRARVFAVRISAG